MKKFTLSILTHVWAMAVAIAQQGSVSFDVAAPTAVEAGEAFRIEFTVNAEGARLTTPPSIEGFEVLAGPIESMGVDVHQVIGGSRTQTHTTTYSYVLRGQTAGLHSIGAAQVAVGSASYSSKPVSIEVVAGAARGGAGQGQGSAPEIGADDVMLRATANTTEVYKGEPVVVTLKFYRRINAGLGDFKFPTFNGFWQQDITLAGEPSPQRESLNGRAYDTWVLKEYLLYPQQSGSLTIDPFRATVTAVFQARGAQSRNIFDEFFGMGQATQRVEKEIASTPLRIEVREWPEEGRPAGFDGAVGSFTLDATPPAATMGANSSASYTLRLSGTGNFPLVRASKLQLPQSFESYDVKTSDQTRHNRSGTSGYKEFSYPFIPRTDGRYTIPAFEFSYFDPRQRRYATLSSNQVTIEVTADTTALRTATGGMVGGVSRDELKVFGQDIRFIKRGAAGLRPKGRTFMLSAVYLSLAGLLVALFVAGLVVLPRWLRNMQSDSFVRGKRANRVALKRFRAAEACMKRGDRHGFHNEMLKALWGYMSDKFNIPMADLTRERIREELFVRSVPEARSDEYVRIIAECEQAQYSPSSSSGMGELYGEGVSLVSELESTINKKLS